MSLTRLDTIKTKPTDPKDAGQFNTSSNRMSLTFETTDLPDRVNTFLTLRYVNGYMFRSGAIWGRVPSFGSLDVAASYRVPSQGMTVTLQAQNIAGCVGGTSTLPATGISTTSMATYTKAPRCAFGQKHAELLSMPALGPMIFLGIRKEWW